MSNPCSACDITDGDEPEVEERACCTPPPVKKPCGAPVLPVPDCDEEPPVMEYNPVTEQFSVVSVLYDESCSAILDQNNDAITTLMS
jgi:hypothetical protein